MGCTNTFVEAVHILGRSISLAGHGIFRKL